MLVRAKLMPGGEGLVVEMGSTTERQPVKVWRPRSSMSNSDQPGNEPHRAMAEGEGIV